MQEKTKNIAELFSISLIALYFEILIIRWLSSEIRIFAYFKNVPLMACLFGLGLGMAIANKKRDFSKWFPLCLFAIATILSLAATLKLTHVCFVNPLECYLIGSFTNGIIDDTIWTRLIFFFTGICVLVGIFYFIVFTFMCLGQRMGRLFSELKPLPAYCINIGASILGILLFSAISFFSVPPLIWLLVGVILCLYSFRKPFQIVVLVCTLLITFVLSDTKVTWSPYYRITQEKAIIPQDGKNPPFDYGRNIIVNYDTIEGAYNNNPVLLSHLSAHQFKSTADYYDTPYLALGDKPRSILILAAGTGNDAAAALRHGAMEVDAVEIDPVIGKLGQEIHPEQPYSNPKVNLIINDARAYLRNSKKKYDLIVFAYLDSHTAFSSMSNLRLDNYVYTKESFTDAKKLLKPGGAISVTFYYLTWWQLAHVYHALEEGTNEKPQGVYSPMENGPTLLVGANLDQKRLNELGLKTFLPENLGKVAHFSKEQWSDIVAPSDDWPYVFLRDRQGSWSYSIGIIFTLFLGYGLIKFCFKNFFGEPLAHTMFFLGAAFMLIETKSVTQMGLLMGTTWFVNSAVVTAILILILIANIIQLKFQIKNIRVLFALLFFSLIVNYFVPLSVFDGLDNIARIVFGVAFLCMPILFAAMIFAIAFSRVERADRALGINLLGALVGGALEYLSMIFGLNALNLIAIGLYCLAYYYMNKGTRLVPVNMLKS